MFERLLISALDKAHGPRTVAGLARALEFTTGLKTADLMGRKGVSIDFEGFGNVTPPDTLWYRENGFFGLANILGAGYSNYSGKLLTPDTSLESSAVYGCTKIFSEDIGALERTFSQRSPDRRSEEPAYSHPLYPILHDMPNPDMNASAFWESIIASAILCKDGYIKIDRDSKGTVLFLWPLAAGSVTRDKNRFGRPVFKWKDGNSAEKDLAAEQVMNVPGFSMNGASGDDMLRRARHVLGLTLATQEYPARFFSADASPGIILKRPVGGAPWDDPKIQAIKEAWKRWHQGSGRAHEPAVLQDGLDAMRLDPDHQKLQMMEARKFQILEVCRVMRMKPYKLADLDRATFGNIEHQSIEYVRDSLMPWTIRIEQSVYRCLLTPAERTSGHFLKHNLEEAMRGDFGSQAEALTRLQAAGDISQNEVRRRLHLPPASGGDKLYIQLNMQAVADAATGVVIDQGTKMMPAGETAYLQ